MRPLALHLEDHDASLSRLRTLVALAAFAITSGAWIAHTSAEMSTPTAGADDATLILIEHADLVTEIDLGEPGASVGDILVWGPNALYDEAEVFGSKRAEPSTAATSG